jgi:hypothetical protein
MIIKLSPSDYELVCEFTIPGKLPRKSNSRIFVGTKGTPRLIKSKEAIAYVKNLTEEVSEEYRNEIGSLTEHLLVVANVYYPSRRSDLSTELLLDGLEEIGVFKNDRYVTEKLESGLVDPDNPRAEVQVYKVLNNHTPIKVILEDDNDE